jgi:hypothetical protein
MSICCLSPERAISIILDGVTSTCEMNPVVFHQASLKCSLNYLGTARNPGRPREHEQSTNPLLLDILDSAKAPA